MKYEKTRIKIFMLILISTFLTACTMTSALYQYSSYPDKGFSRTYKKTFDISAAVMEIEREDSPVESIRVYDRQYDTFAEIVSPTIRVVDRFGKEYILNVNEKYRYAVNVHKQGVILQGEFKASIGKVRRKDGSIVDVPPLVFRQYVNSTRFNPVMGAMNIDTKEEVFSGTIEEYKKGDWKEKKKK